MNCEKGRDKGFGNKGFGNECEKGREQGRDNGREHGLN